MSTEHHSNSRCITALLFVLDLAYQLPVHFCKSDRTMLVYMIRDILTIVCNISVQ